MPKEMTVCHVCSAKRLLPKRLESYVKPPRCKLCNGRLISNKVR